MFELPEAKRVRRADLNAWGDSAGSESNDEGYDVALQARLNAQIARSLGLDESYGQARDLAATPSHLPGCQSDRVDADVEADVEADIEEEEDAGNEEFAFRLFSSTRPSQKIVLEEDTGPKGDGGLVRPRPLSHYMVTNLTPNQKHQYAFAAMSGDEVLARSKDRAWGLEVPWKVTKIAVTRKRKPGESTCTAEDEMARKKKPRPGKKQRILLRKRAKTDENRKQAEAQKLLQKEEHSKDKKKRMNRLKKLRKRAKNKEMKLAAKDGGAGAGESGSDDDDSEGSD
ncbi:hypothetical protein QQZ08_005573 [Neonectria magnoliae]|uniref:Uncharacterized protein n=1 Tax=Neonectria magnoliae TaxID=2732573 RepID=A0ABR1I386_9HYPO